MRAKLVAATTEFGQLAGRWAAFRNKNVLDVGMGQGPIGVAALEAGVATYTGLDPALSIDRHARTRDKSVGHMDGSGSSCHTPCSLSNASATCRACRERVASKYRNFPFTGLEMMAAYPNRLVLLPGTFESIESNQAALQRARRAAEERKNGGLYI